MSLKTRILVLVLGLIIVGVWGFAARMAEEFQADLQKVIAAHLATQIDYAVDELDGELNLRVALLKEIARGVVFDSGAGSTRIQRLLNARTPSFTMFPLGVLIVSKAGEIVAGYRAPRATLQRAVLERRKRLREVMSKVTSADKPLIGSPLAAGHVPAYSIIPIAVPLHDRDGAVTGALIGPVISSDADLFGRLTQAKIGRTGRFLVFSVRDGVIVWATDKSRIMRHLPPRGANPLLDRRLYEGFEAPEITTTSLGVRVLGLSRRLKTTGWVVVAGIGTHEAFAPLTPLKRQIYITAVLFTLAMALLLILVLRQQLSPLGEADHAIQLMATNKVAFAPIRVRRRDEVGHLVENFNHLVNERQRAEREIRDLNRNLEARVRDRTDELLAANQRLEAEIGERKKAEESALHYAERLQLISRRTVSAQETERRRLARELHDGVSSNFAVIHLNLEAIEKQLSEGNTTGLSNKVSDCLAVVEDSSSMIRELSSDLHPPMLDYMGLAAALEELGRKFTTRTGIAVTVAGADPETRLPLETEIALFRITQEALTNCAKHSGARDIAIDLKCNAQWIQLSVADDGVGFEVPYSGPRGQAPGLGLLSMQERAEAVGGDLHISSAPGNGTQVIVRIPRSDAPSAPEYVI